MVKIIAQLVKMRKSRRYCLNCKKITTFKYKRKLGHSKCSECGNTTALSIKYAKEQGYIKQGGNQNGIRSGIKYNISHNWYVGFHTVLSMGDKDGIFCYEGEDSVNNSLIANNLFYSNLAKKQVIKLKEKKSITILWKSVKILTFVIFFYTAGIMFKLRNTVTAILIIFAVSFFLIFNKIDSMDRRLKLLEEK